MLGAYPQAAGRNRRHMADCVPPGRSCLVSGAIGATVAAVGDTRLRVPAAHHLFRTPSSGGRVRAFVPARPAFFLLPASVAPAGMTRRKPAIPGIGRQRRLVGPAPIRLYPSWNRMPALRVVLVGMFLNKGAGSCVSSKSERFLPPWRRLRHAATQWGNRPSSVRARVRQRLLFWTATFLQAQLSEPPATRCIARAARAGAADRPRDRAGLIPRYAADNDTFASNDAAPGQGPGCGFSCFFQSQPKDDSCSRRS